MQSTAILMNRLFLEVGLKKTKSYFNRLRFYELLRINVQRRQITLHSSQIEFQNLFSFSADLKAAIQKKLN